MLEIIIGILAVVIDQISKIFIMTNLGINKSIPVIKNIFHITYIHNTGVAFGMMNGYNYKILIGIVLFLVLLIFNFFNIRKDLSDIYAQNKSSFVFRFATGLFVGGALGNIIDRLFRGFVVDFLDFRIWPIFNFADSFICIAFCLFVLYFISRKGNKTISE